MKEYFQLIKECILNAELELSEKDKLPEFLIQCWLEEIESLINKKYKQYLIGKIEDYELDIPETEEAFNKAGLRYTESILNGLVDKDMIQAGIRDDGEIVYSVTEKGKNELL